MANHFFFTLHPTKAKFKTKGSATHYARNKGVMYFDANLARYIANCVALGEEAPSLFVCGWLNRKENVMNIGLEIPRDKAVEQILELQGREQARLMDFFHED